MLLMIKREWQLHLIGIFASILAFFVGHYFKEEIVILFAVCAFISFGIGLAFGTGLTFKPDPEKGGGR